MADAAARQLQYEYKAVSMQTTQNVFGKKPLKPKIKMGSFSKTTKESDLNTLKIFV